MAGTAAPGGLGPAVDGAAVRTIPEATVARLTAYLQVLGHVGRITAPAGAATAGSVLAGPDRADEIISSEELAALAGVNSAKLRKDLSYLGTHGTRGVGYDVATLTDALRRALGAHDVYPVAVAGVGHLGSALAGYRGFAGRGFPIRLLLDCDPAKIGTAVAGLPVVDIREAASACRDADVAIGVIATPEAVAQQVADVLIAAGIRSILNFAPGSLTVPEGVEVRRVDLALELQLLAFHESRRERTRVST